MKQVTQRLRDGAVAVVDVPAPTLAREAVLVDVRASLLSAGTERAKIEAGRKSLAGKARSRPDQVGLVIDKLRSDGLVNTTRAVRARLNEPGALGYSASGVVLQVGAQVHDLAPGDRVACGGGDYAVHADIVHVPGNLCVRLPEGLSFEHGSFTTVGSIAMHAVRQAEVRLGERVAVIGLGLVGQLTGQILRAAGCYVVGIDLSAALVEKALERRAADAAFGRADLDRNALPPDARNCDAVIITAATKSSDPVQLAPSLCRDRGTVVVVGDVAVDVPRVRYYERELQLRLSRSYGPGRYDREYEERGLDYPIGYVRWTERRNMSAFLGLVADGRVDVDGLILERTPVARAGRAYERLLSTRESPLGIVLEYTPSQATAEHLPARTILTRDSAPEHWQVTNVVGTGSFARRILIPGLRRAGFELRSAASAGGLSARAAMEQFGFTEAVTPEEAIGDEGAGLVAIATRHSSHAALAEAALSAGKAVYVEKPPALTLDELSRLRNAREISGRPLFVGFNRRFAPLAQMFRDHVRAAKAPIDLVIRVNAGLLSADHWLDDEADGGGRLLGEGCHFVDLACWVIESPVSQVTCTTCRERGGSPASSGGFSATLRFSDDSVATIHYTARGARALHKEYIEGHAGGRSAVLDDFRQLRLVTDREVATRSTRKQDKGHFAQIAAVWQVLAGQTASTEPDPLDSMAVTLAAWDAAKGAPALALSRSAAEAAPNGAR